VGAPIIGRSACPECGFENAHVKRSAKCLYRYCPECGAMYHATGAEREKRLLAVTRLAEPGPTPTPTEIETEPNPAPGPDPVPTPTPSPAPVDEPAPTPTRKRAGFFTI
jgi:Zn-finger nucleic acid-binding protein